MAAETNLTPAQEALIPISAFAANGNEEKLAAALNAGLDSGLTINEIREALIQLYAYAGFPRSLTALSTFMKVLDKRAAEGKKDKAGEEPKTLAANTDRNALGTKIQTELIGRPVKGPLFEFAPGIDQFLKEHLFCDIFARGVLSNQDRELVTTAALAALPAPAQLASHVAVSKNVGLTKQQMEQYVKVLASQVGQKEADLAGLIVEKVYSAN